MKFYLHSFSSVNNSAKFEMARKVNEQLYRGETR